MSISCSLVLCCTSLGGWDGWKTGTCVVVGIIENWKNYYMRVDGRGIHIDHTCSCTKICVMNANDTHPNNCHASFWTSSGLTTLWMSILCENLSQMLNGIKEVVLWVSVLATRWRKFLCAQLSSVDELIQWHSIGHEVIGHIEEGKEKKASKVEFDQIPPKKLIYYI
jgi:hypothetical protein